MEPVLNGGSAYENPHPVKAGVSAIRAKGADRENEGANARRKASGLPGRRRRERLSYIFVRNAPVWLTSKRDSSTHLPGSTSRRPGSPVLVSRRFAQKQRRGTLRSE